MKYTNVIRTDPKSFVPDLKNMLNKFNGMKRTVINKKGSVVQNTKEGSKAVEELITFLEKQKPLPALKYDQKLKDFACQHVKDQGPTGKVGHDGAVSDESWMQRVGGLL